MRTLADLAAQQGIELQTFLNRASHKEAGYPAPVSSPGAQALLFDGEQIDAYLTGRPVPPLRAEEDVQEHEAMTSWTAARPPPSSASSRTPGASTNVPRFSPST
ncbi:MULTISPECIES: hypothetical protein [Streptomyces]|uniref:hypothetical protein n=1 Tax=Streptomyces TaxID=1883 RepID=UPI00131A5E66|nr:MULTISPECIES: hypothetical protein [Streptomyces]MDP9954343.1 hypothetical protein [Streptomyces sp. DSM 41269]